MSHAMPQFASDLVSFLAGRLTKDELRSKHPRNEFGEVSEIIWGSLEHFLADADKRHADSAYANMQISEMRKLVNLLESGGSVAKYSEITFLDDGGSAIAT